MTDELDVDLRFAILPEWVLDADVSDRAVRLYAVLDRFAGESRRAWPSRETLARRLNCSRESVDRAVRELRSLEAIEVQNRRLDDGQPTSNLYVLRRAPSSPMTTVVVSGDEQGGRDSDEQVAAPMTTERESLNESHGNEIAVAGATETKRATRIPDRFFLSEPMIDWARTEVPNIDLRRETANFCDYWRAASGRTSTKRDWVAAWRVWMRKADGDRRVPARKQSNNDRSQAAIANVLPNDRLEITR